MALCRYTHNENLAGSWGWLRDGLIHPLDTDDVIAVLTQTSQASLYDLANLTKGEPIPEDSVSLLAPLHETQEVWAAGVTYESSKFARMSESENASDLYAKVYTADRPELFFKATPSRVVGPSGKVRIRFDSKWNVPEPELAALIAADGRILGYTIGNDMSSRDIEGENALYLPQAKVYRACCGLGPTVVPAELVDPQNLTIHLTIKRNNEIVFDRETSTAKMKRTVEEIAKWLFRENDFPEGVFLLTGTGIVPDDSFTLLSGDEIIIAIESLGELINNVI